MAAAVDALTATYGTEYQYGNTAVTICKDDDLFPTQTTVFRDVVHV